MEYDKPSNNNKLFFFGIICLVLSLGLLLLSLYILPYIIWQLNYKIPTLVLDLIAQFQVDYHYSPGSSRAIVWLIFFIPCMIAGLISYFVSNYLDKIDGYEQPPMITEEEKPNSDERQKQIRESAGLGLKIIGLMIVIVLVILLLEFIIQSTV